MKTNQKFWYPKKDSESECSNISLNSVIYIVIDKMHYLRKSYISEAVVPRYFSK